MHASRGLPRMSFPQERFKFGWVRLAKKCHDSALSIVGYPVYIDAILCGCFGQLDPTSKLCR